MTGLLIDDDPLVAQAIEHFVEKSELVERCEHASDAATAANCLSAKRFDFVLLDLHLPDLPGQSVLQSIPSSVPVIVVSTDPGFGAASYRYANIVDYVLKPLDYLAFHRAIERVVHSRESAEGASASPPRPADGGGQVIFIKSGTEIIRLVLDEIRLVKAEANYVSFHCGAVRPVMALTTLKRIADELPANFLRVHRSYIVNRDHIERIDGQVVHVNDSTIPIGDSYRAGFLAKLGVIS